jgi:tetratricopeptide (TPR) repeat protein
LKKNAKLTINKIQIAKMKTRHLSILNKSLSGIFSLVILWSCSDTDHTIHDELIENDFLIEFTDDQGNKISKEELLASSGVYGYEIIGEEYISPEADAFQNEGRQFGQLGEYLGAIEKFTAAHETAPKWPYPPYDLAYTYLLQGDQENALKYYEVTDSLAPRGFFTSKTALHTLKREKSGELPEGVYMLYLSLEWVQDEKERGELIEYLVIEFPGFAPGWKEYSTILEGQERLDAIETGLSVNPDIETMGILSINKAIILNDRGDYQTAEKLLLSVIFDSSSTLVNVELAKFVLGNML